MNRPPHFGQNDATDKVPLPAPVTSSDFIRWLQLLQMKIIARTFSSRDVRSDSRSGHWAVPKLRADAQLDLQIRWHHSIEQTS